MTSRTRIKVCGLREAATLQAAVEAGADAVGFVFAPSPRRIEPSAARPLIATLPAFVEPVGLFVDAPASLVREAAALAGLRTVQLHGAEPPETVEALSPLRVIKAMAFDAQDPEASLARWRGLAFPPAALLLDSPPAAGVAGGTGRRFDWGGLARWLAKGGAVGLPPLIVAGGLTPSNVGELIAQVAPYAVDVSSGVESSRGVKDAGLIAAFCEGVRIADRSRGARVG